MNYDRIILKLLDRVSALEDEVEVLKKGMSKNTETNENIKTESNYQQSKNLMGRDTTKYLLDGKRYGKNRLVLAIVKKYMEEHPDVSSDELMSVFDRSLQGSLGVVRKLDEVKASYSDYKRRFFCLENYCTESEFVTYVTQKVKKHYDDIFICLRIKGFTHPKSKRPMKRAEDYIKYFTSIGWNVCKVVDFQNANNPVALGNITSTLTLTNTHKDAANYTASLVRNYFNWI